MAEIKWIKIRTDIFEDEKISLIESLPKHDGIIIIWFKLLCMAGKQNNGGVFKMNDSVAYTDAMLAKIFKRPLTLVKSALSTFEQYGMIEIIDGVITIPNWEKHQNIDELNKIKEQTRNRVAAHRERQKLTLDERYCNVTVQKCNATDKEEDKDIDIDKKEKNKKEKGETDFDRLISDFSENGDLQLAIYEFIKMRKSIKAPLTTHALELILKKLSSLASEDGQKIAILNQSIENGWRGVFELKTSEKGTSEGNRGKYSNFDNRKDVDYDEIERANLRKRLGGDNHA